MLKSNQTQLKDYSLSGYNWKKFEQEREENRDLSPSKIGQSMSTSNTVSTTKKGVNKVSNNQNILEPLVDVSIDLCKLSFKLICKLLKIESKFSIEDFFIVEI